MAGIRIVHDTLRNGYLTVLHPTKKYREPYYCPQCRELHLNKAIHVYLDDVGAGIVSVETFELLRQAGLPGLHYANEVLDPPAQRVAVGGEGMTHAEKLKLLTPVTPYRYEGHFKRLHVIKNRFISPRKV